MRRSDVYRRTEETHAEHGARQLSRQDWLLEIEEHLNEALDNDQNGYPAEAEDELLIIATLAIAALEQLT